MSDNELNCNHNHNEKHENENCHTHSHENCSCHSHSHNHNHKHSHSHENEKHEHHHEHHHDNLKCSCCHDDDDEHEHEEESKSVVIKRMIISAISLALAIFFEHFIIIANVQTQNIQIDFGKTIYLALYLISYLPIAKPVFHGAIKNIRKGNIFGEQFLMCVASLGAIFIGEYAEGVAVILLYTLGEFFQDYAVDKSRDSISALMDIRPEKANVIRNGKIESVLLDEIKIGEIIEVKPGERIGLDGKIIEGESFADTSALTGESVPRKIKVDDEVLAGFVNTNGVLKIKVTKPNSESAITRILNLTQKESKVKTRSEKFITRFSKVYTPIVCILAVFVAIFPSTILRLYYPQTFESLGGYQTFFYRALMFLVVSCPCALVISVPLSFFCGIGAFSKNGILVKGSNFIENLAKLKTVVFDKTGTLTKGIFSVSKIHAIEISENELLSLTALAESKSNHPIAKSILEEFEKTNKNCDFDNLISKIEEISGHGIRAIIKEENSEKCVLVGNAKLMKNENISDFVETEDAGTIVYVAVDSKFKGFLVISDEIKENSKSALEKLKKVGIQKNVMLTGDSERVAKAVADELKIDEIHANLLPENKVQEIEKIINSSSKKEKVAFVGDGVNDSPVLARADVGIAMGALGSDAAIEAADVVIMDDSLERLSKGIKIAKKTLAIVTQNIVFSLSIKVLIMILSALGITNMWVAVFGDVGVCFLAILNATRSFKN